MTSKFFELVQKHEREWGATNYPERPTLEQLMMSPVVAFWQADDSKEKRLMVSTHADLKEIELSLIKLIMRVSVQKPERLFVQAYQDKKRLKVKGFNILFETDES
jgi:hypothetical protein